MKRHLAIGLTALVSVSMLAACSSDDDDSTSDVQEANTAFCQDLSAYGASLTAFAALDPATATKADYDAAADTVKSARSDLAESRAELVGAELDNLETQADDLNGALADAPDDAVVADIVTAAQAQVTQIEASAAAVNTAVCTAENSAATTEG
jgi:hypothetical protein